MQCTIPSVDSERAQRQYAADTEHDLLADSHVLVAAVEHRCDLAGLGRILRDIGVEQIERHESDPDFPDLYLNRDIIENE